MSVCRNHAVFLFVSTLSQFPELDKITSPSARIPVVHRAPPPPPLQSRLKLDHNFLTKN